MQCYICRDYFDRGTDSKPSNICDFCLTYRVEIIEITKTPTEIIEDHNNVIKLLTEEIIKYKNKIIHNEEIIKEFEKEIMELQDNIALK